MNRACARGSRPRNSKRSKASSTRVEPSRRIRAQRSIEEIRRYLGADTLGYVSLASLRRAVDDTRGSFCTSCYTGVYPVDGSQGELESRAAEPEETPGAGDSGGNSGGAE